MADEEHDAERERREQAADDRLARRRFEARSFGFSRAEADEFAASDVEIGQLRRLIAGGCPVPLAVRILAEV